MENNCAYNQSNEEILIYDIKSPRQIENINVDYRNSNYKQIKIYFEEFNEYIVLKQDFRLGKGGIFWDGSYVLTKILFEKLLKNKSESLNILELGAGTSLPSLFCSFLGHKVSITDIKKNTEFIKNIVDANIANLQKCNSNASLSSVHNLNWENANDIQNLKSQSEFYDIIIGSELIYLDEYFDDLINVLKQFSNSDTQIILSYKIRLPEMVQEFFSKFSQHFEYLHIEDSFIHQYYPLPNKLKIIIAKIK